VITSIHYYFDSHCLALHLIPYNYNSAVGVPIGINVVIKAMQIAPWYVLMMFPPVSTSAIYHFYAQNSTPSALLSALGFPGTLPAEVKRTVSKGRYRTYLIVRVLTPTLFRRLTSFSPHALTC
jgi:hypothetical protein